MAYVHITIRDFSKGWNTTEPSVTLTDDSVFQAQMPGYNRPDLVQDAQYPQMLNLFVTYGGRLKNRGGQHKVFATSAPPQGVARFSSPTKTWLMVAAGKMVKAYDEAGGTTLTPYSAPATGLAPPAQPPQVVRTGNSYPSQGPFLGGGTYTYVATYADSASGAESAPSAESGSVTIPATTDPAYAYGATIMLSSIPTSPDAGVDTINIYRKGATISSYTRVMSCPISTGSVYQFTSGQRYIIGDAEMLAFPGDYALSIFDSVNDTGVPGPTLNTAGTAGAARNGLPVDFAAIYGNVYWADGISGPQKWDGSAASSSRLGLAPPTTGPIVTNATTDYTLGDQTAGFPNGAYTYFYTYGVSATGAESSASPASSSFTTTNAAVNLQGFLVSTDPTVDTIHIYRIGGSSASVRLVASIPLATIPDAPTYAVNSYFGVLTPSRLVYVSPDPPLLLVIGGDYNIIVTDACPDILLSSQTAPTNHDPPPSSVTFLYPFNNRLWAAGDPSHPYRLYFSNYGQPDYWPLSVLDPINDGAYFDVDPRFGNAIIALSSIGSLLVVGSLDSLHIVIGDTLNNMVVRQVSDYGCIARRSMVRCDDQLLYLGPDGMVYSLQEAKPSPAALAVEATLKTLTRAELTGACACYQDQRYLLCIPREAGLGPVFLCYDFRVGAWTDLSDPALAATALYAAEGQALYGEVLFATKSGYTFSDGTAYTGIVSFLAPQDAGTSQMPISFETPAFEMGRPTFTKRARRVRIEGTLAVPAGGSCTATVRARTVGQPDVTRTYTLTPQATAGTLLDVETSAQVVGRQLAVLIGGSVTALEVNTIDLSFAYLREAV